jgi:hypothetical protein
MREREVTPYPTKLSVKILPAIVRAEPRLTQVVELPPELDPPEEPPEGAAAAGVLAAGVDVVVEVELSLVELELGVDESFLLLEPE